MGEKKFGQEEMKKAGLSQVFLLKESLPNEEEEVYTVDEVEQETVEDLAQPHIKDHLQEILPFSGPPNLWKHSGLKIQSVQQDMTILPLIDGPLNWKGRNLEMELRAAEKGLVELDQHDPQGRINLHALDA